MPVKGWLEVVNLITISIWSTTELKSNSVHFILSHFRSARQANVVTMHAPPLHTACTVLFKRVILTLSMIYIEFSYIYNHQHCITFVVLL